MENKELDVLRQVVEKGFGKGDMDVIGRLIQYVVNGNIVWVHYRFTGVHTGVFMGVEPAGKPVSIDVMDIARIEDGKLVEHWGIPDRFSLLVQLGKLPKV